MTTDSVKDLMEGPERMPISNKAVLQNHQEEIPATTITKDWVLIVPTSGHCLPFPLKTATFFNLKYDTNESQSSCT